MDEKGACLSIVLCVIRHNVSHYACKKMNYSIAFSILLRYTHLKASVYNLFLNNLKINGGRTDSLCFSRNYFLNLKSKGILVHSSLCEDYFMTEGGDYYRKKRYGDKKFNELPGGVC